MEICFTSIFGVLCAIASAVAAIYNAEAAYLFIATPIGNILALKVDGIHHILTLVIFIVLLLIFGIPQLSLVVLLICILATLADEVGHELISTVTDNRFLNLFFEYRFVLKIAVLLLAVCGVFNIWIFVCFILFDVAYTMAEISFEKLN